MTAKSKRSVFTILTVVLLGVLVLAGVLVSRNEQGVGDIRVFTGDSDKLYVVPFASDGEGEGDGAICFFLPFPAEIGAYRIYFPKDDKVYIDGVEYSSGNALFSYVAGEKHRLEVLRRGKTVSKDVVFYYADIIPAVSIDMEDGAFEKMSADTMHLDKKSSNITIVNPETHLNTSEYCYIGGHGGSSWDCEKKSYEITLLRPISFLGMKTAEKWTLISNGMDYSNLKNRVVYEAVSQIGMEYGTDCEYVNLYVNGNYQGLYLLTGRISGNGGVVDFDHDLDVENRMLNSDVITDSSLPDPVIVDEGTLSEEKYYDLKYDPADITGDYLMEFVQYGIPQAYNPDSTWFLTDRMMVKMKSPKIASEKELHYAEDYVIKAEDAVFGEGDYRELIDTDSWAMVYLFMDFFGYQDDSAGSLYFYKKRNDPVLYCGPIWDYDKSMTDNFYDEEPFPYYGRAFFDVVYGENDRYQLWHARLNEYPEFHERVMEHYRDKLEPVMGAILEDKVPEWIDETTSSVRMDEIRWNRGEGFEAGRAREVETWLHQRKQLFDQVWIRGEESPYAENIY